MPGEARQGELKNHLAGALRPTAVSFRITQSKQMTAYIYQNVREFRTDRIESLQNTLARGQRLVGQPGGPLWSRAAIAS